MVVNGTVDDVDCMKMETFPNVTQPRRHSETEKNARARKRERARGGREREEERGRTRKKLGEMV